jgi:hypothetical protein
MTVQIKLSTGKIIELTDAEARELFSIPAHTITITTPSTPWYPPLQPSAPWWIGTAPTITCNNNISST